METTYKVGDRVRIGKSICGSKAEGRLGIVVPWKGEESENGLYVSVEVDGNPQMTKNPFPFRPHEIEHYKPKPKYKVGDKVVVTGKRYEDCGWWYGWEGTVSRLAEHLSNDLPVYTIEFEGKDFTSGGFSEDEISLCEEPGPKVPDGYRLLEDHEIPNLATDLRAYPYMVEYTKTIGNEKWFGKTLAEIRGIGCGGWKDISFCRPIDECPPIPEGFERVDDPEYVLQEGDKYSCGACRMACNKRYYPDGWDTVRSLAGETLRDINNDEEYPTYVCRPVTVVTPEWIPTEEYLTLQKWVRGDEEQWRSE